MIDKQKARSILEIIFSEHQHKGIEAIYLWGSITTEDFDPEKSDIDAIALVNDLASDEDRTIINDELGKQSRLSNFKINFLYLNELNDGEIKGSLAKVISPAILLLDFPYWEHVAGKQFSRADFSLPHISFDEAIEIELNEITRRFLPYYEAGNFKDIPYFCKLLFRVCYFIDQKTNPPHPFSYNYLMKHSSNKLKAILQDLEEVRASDWDQNLFQTKWPTLRMFVTFLVDGSLLL